MTLMLSFLCYTTLVRFQLRKFKRKKGYYPTGYRMFFIYRASFINKLLSHTEQHFYRRLNTITIFFNTLIVLSAIGYFASLFL